MQKEKLHSWDFCPSTTPDYCDGYSEPIRIDLSEFMKRLEEMPESERTKFNYFSFDGKYLGLDNITVSDVHRIFELTPNIAFWDTMCDVKCDVIILKAFETAKTKPAMLRLSYEYEKSVAEFLKEYPESSLLFNTCILGGILQLRDPEYLREHLSEIYTMAGLPAPSDTNIQQCKNFHREWCKSEGISYEELSNSLIIKRLKYFGIAVDPSRWSLKNTLNHSRIQHEMKKIDPTWKWPIT